MVIQLLSLSGTPKHVRVVTCATKTDVLVVVKEYVEPAGFRDIKIVEENDPYDGFRVTATTPGGRHGRNVAFGDYD